VSAFQCHAEYIGKTAFFAIPEPLARCAAEGAQPEKAGAGSKLPSIDD
jgi:hypothetical protein